MNDTTPPARVPGQRWTAKKIQALKDEQFKAGYLSGHSDGHKQAQREGGKHSPFVEFAAGGAVGVIVTAVAFFMH
jgi:flagellar biosynthesis/type III secretory pathway protein FliH